VSPRERDRPDPDAAARRRRPDRVGDLLPEAARRLGLEDELRLARAIATWDALVAERVPAAVGACRLVRLEPDAVVVEADEPLVAAELRMRALELLAAFGTAPGGRRVRLLRLTGPSGPAARGSAAPRV
jgi:predicted nucleic acid-binding Zn ribbon protein